jgi:hypothetical protein
LFKLLPARSAAMLLVQRHKISVLAHLVILQARLVAALAAKFSLRFSPCLLTPAVAAILAHSLVKPLVAA